MCIRDRCTASCVQQHRVWKDSRACGIRLRSRRGPTDYATKTIFNFLAFFRISCRCWLHCELRTFNCLRYRLNRQRNRSRYNYGRFSLISLTRKMSDFLQAVYVVRRCVRCCECTFNASDTQTFNVGTLLTKFIYAKLIKQNQNLGTSRTRNDGTRPNVRSPVLVLLARHRPS